MNRPDLDRCTRGEYKAYVEFLERRVAVLEEHSVDPVPDPTPSPQARPGAAKRQEGLERPPSRGTDRAVVFDAVRSRAGETGKGITRDEISRKTGLADSSADARVWELKRGGWIKEADPALIPPRMTRAGRKANALVLTLKAERFLAREANAV